MKGFFEYQYLSYKKKHMMNLIALARTDGNFHEKEVEILYRIGKKYELKSKHINALLDSGLTVEKNLPGNHDQKMEQLYDLVEMMLADGIIAEKEVMFCEKMVKSMGYHSSLLNILIEFVQFELKDQESWIKFKEEAKNYQKNLIF